MKITNHITSNPRGRGRVGAQYGMAILGALAVLAFASFDVTYGQASEIEHENDRGYLQTIYPDSENTVTVSVPETGIVGGVTASLVLWPCEVTVELVSPHGTSTELVRTTCDEYTVATYEISSSAIYNGESVTGDWVFLLGDTENASLYRDYISSWSLAISTTDTATATTTPEPATTDTPATATATGQAMSTIPTFDPQSVDTYPPSETEICISDIIEDDSDGTALGDAYHNLHAALKSQPDHMFKLPLLEDDYELPTSLTKVHDGSTGARFQYHGQPVPLTDTHCFSLLPMHFHGDGISFGADDSDTFEHPVYIFGTDVADNTADYRIVGQFNVHHTIKNAIDMNYDGTLYGFKDPTGTPEVSFDLARFVTLKGSLSSDIAYTMVDSEGTHFSVISDTSVYATIDETFYPNTITVRAIAEADGVSYTAEETYWLQVLPLPYGLTHMVQPDRGTTTADLSLDTYSGFTCTSDATDASQTGITYTGTFPAGFTDITCTDGVQRYAFTVEVESAIPYLIISDPTKDGTTYSFTATINDPSNQSPTRYCNAYQPGTADPVTWTISGDTYSTDIDLDSDQSITVYCKLYVGSELVDLETVVLSPAVQGASGENDNTAGSREGGSDGPTGSAGPGSDRDSRVEGDQDNSDGPGGASGDDGNDCMPEQNEEKRQDLQDRIEKREAKLAWAQDRLDTAEPHQEKRIEKMKAMIEKLTARIAVLQQQLDCTS